MRFVLGGNSFNPVLVLLDRNIGEYGIEEMGIEA